MKKNREWIALAVILFFTPQAALADNVYIPAVISPLTATTAVVTQSARVNYVSRLSVSTNIFRGDFAENLMRGYFSGGGDLYSNKAWYSLDPGGIYMKNRTVSLLDPSKPGRAGIDGLFVQADKTGNLTGLMVGESKFGSSQLGQTTNGKQMSDDWVKARLKAASTHYKRMATLAEHERISQSRTPPKTSRKITELPLSNKQSARIWYDDTRGSYAYYSEEPVDVETIIKQLNRMSQYISGATEGKISVGKNLWRVEVKNDGSLLVTTEQVDAQGNPIKGTLQRVEPLSGRYEQLTPQGKKFWDKSMTDTLKKYFESKGYSSAMAAKKAREELETAKTTKGGVTDLVKKYNLNQERWNWRASGSVALTSGGIGAGISVLFDVGFTAIDWLQGRRFNLDAERTLKNAGLVFLSASGGTMAGLAVSHWTEKQLASSSQSLLIKIFPENLKNSGKLSGLLGGTTGGLIASAIIAYGPALLNGEDLSAANRMMVTGVATTATGALASYAIMQTAMLVGTASTGTAISTLSGAVATKAALAWLGGGAISAGGGGVAVGGTVLSGGTLLIVIGIGFLVSRAWVMLDENNHSERVDNLLNAYK
jgi:hypothetical protein